MLNSVIIGNLFNHSKGAHIAGQAAKRLNSTDKIGAIIGLDPAGIGFDVQTPESRLAKSDAEYVQVSTRSCYH